MVACTIALVVTMAHQLGLDEARDAQLIQVLLSGMQSDDSNDDDIGEDFIAMHQGPKSVSSVASTAVLDKSDISLSIRQACGIGLNEDLTVPSVAHMIESRERGPNFSCGQKSKITNTFLPNQMKRIAKYNNKPFCGTFSKDGNFLLTTTHHRVLRLYRTDHGEYNEFKKFSVSAVGWSILDTAFSPDARYFVYSSWSDYLYMNSIYGDPNVREPLLLSAEHPMFCVFSVVFSSDGRELFCGGNDGCLYIYDLGSQNCSKVRGHGYDINSVAFADDSSQILYSAGDDGLCKVWDRRELREDDPQPVGVLAGHMGGITFVDPRGDGRHLITNSKDQTIKLWDARKFSSKEAQEEAQVAVSVANNSWDYRWQHVPKKFLYPRKPLEGDTSLMTYRGHIVVQTLIRCHFSPAATTGQRYIYTGCGSGRIIIYDILTGEIVKTLKGHKTVVRDVSWHPTHQDIVSTSWDGEIASWRYHNGSEDGISNASADTSDSDSESPKPARRTRSRKTRRSKRMASA
ncbi:DDB1- and CUL4-associated factor 11 isoform X1 [Nasonia vitripennis]|uniref:DDB1- and CUL4-associated factor 11 n=1 Tax=Nasonia vitripennis TaxID=7425 RepID=A0A7M7LQX5_NASVI|nr:DDB1- and CUL4-associated factor 11 isoform X1 [Nasonia vitripennis]